MRGRLPKNNTHLAFLLDLFQSKKRVDGREWTDFRSFDVSYDPTCRLTHIRLGKTRLMCTLDAEISAPRKSTKPGAGSIAFSVDFLPMAHPSAVETNSFDNEIEQCLVILESLFRDTYCLDFDTLCIESNKYVFDIKCEIKILDYDGGLWDASVLAVSCAITHFKRSDVSYNSITKKLIVHSNDKPPIPLTVYYKPVTTTFGFINGIEDPIIDPTMEESLLVDGFLIIGANHRDEICLISQSGNLNANQKSIEKCCEIALQNVKELIGFFPKKSHKKNSPHYKMEQFKKISSSSTPTTSFRKTSSFKYSPLNLFFILSLILLIQSFNINNNQVNAFISNNNIPSSNTFFRLVRSDGDDSQQQKQPALLSRYGRAAVLSRYGKRSGGRAIVASPSSYDTQQTGPLFLCRPTVENLLFLRCHPYRT